MKIYIEAEKEKEVRNLLDSVYLGDTQTQIENTCKKLGLKVWFADCDNEAYIHLCDIEDMHTFVEY